MDKPFKFALPSPNFNKNLKDACKPKPHFLTPSGMSLLPREKQPPPMYGKHGATVPARYLKQHTVKEQQLVAPTPITTPPPEKQYCEPCELELQSLEDLKRHRAQHEKCPVAGCLYKGHPSVMDKHINALHNSGLFDKFKKLSTPEEIAAWREERRKRYPTLANVLLKQKAQEQRQKRGERLEANKNRFGKINDRKRAQPNRQEDNNQVEEKKPKQENNRNNKRNKNKRNHKNKQQDLPKPKVQNEVKLNDTNMEEQENMDHSCAGIKMFRGTSQLKDYKHFSDKKKVLTNNALFGLVGMYGSDDDDEESESSTDNEIQPVAENVKEVEEINDINPKEEVNKNSEEIMQTEPESVKDENLTKEINDISKDDISQSNCNLDNVKDTISNASKVNTSPAKDVEISSASNEAIITEPNDNSSDEAPEETAIQRTAPDYPIKPDKDHNNAIEESKAKLSQPTEQPSSSKQKKVLKRKSGLDYRKARLRKQNTMLEKLLEADIRHERNVLLQCVRYVCENNFFGIGQSNKKPD